LSAAANSVVYRSTEALCWLRMDAIRPPSDPYTIAGTGFTNVAGDFVCFDCNAFGTNISSTAYSASAGFRDKILQVVWAGARYSVTETVDVVGAYYHYSQNDYTTAPSRPHTRNARAQWTRFLP
jgi:hypothetical protein